MAGASQKRKQAPCQFENPSFYTGRGSCTEKTLLKKQANYGSMTDILPKNRAADVPAGSLSP
jgi:hypothetical protein